MLDATDVPPDVSTAYGEAGLQHNPAAATAADAIIVAAREQALSSTAAHVHERKSLCESLSQTLDAALGPPSPCAGSGDSSALLGIP